MVNVTLFHSRQVILVDANVTFSHVAAVNKSGGWGVKKKAVDVELYFRVSSEG